MNEPSRPERRRAHSPRTAPLGALFFAFILSACGSDPAGDPPRVKEELPEPGPLSAGAATLKLPVPLGIGTMGYGAIAATPSVTPFADNFPGTVRQHGALTLKAVVLSRGEAHEVVLVRADTIGVFQQLREAVIEEVASRTGRDLGDSLVLAGNHTHSGPGRLLMTDGTLTVLGDTFFPEFYERMIHAFADVIEAAFDDAGPAELGHAMASTSEAHNDRRCENDPLDQVQEDPSMPVVVVRREGGEVIAVVLSYAYHGTILSLGDLTLSGDMGGVVEQKIEERFEHPVPVLFFNSWGGDMSPGSPDIEQGAVGADQPSKYDRMEALGHLVADVVMPVISGVSFSSDAHVRARTHRVRLDREVLGYTPGVFPYDHGAAYCGLGSNGSCSHVEPVAGLDRLCLRLGEDDLLPKQTVFTSGRIGDLRFVTGPGEWSTNLAVGVLERIHERSGGEAMFIGYANDYTGYSLNEEDWWQGGYEASGGLWGPRQGDYLAARLVESFETFEDEYLTPPFEEPPSVPPFSGYEVVPYEPEAPIELGEIVSDVPGAVSATEIVSLTVRGSDPWLGTPVATLEREVEPGVFEPVLRPNGTAVDSDGYELWIDLAADPPYDEALEVEERAFEWTFNLPASRRVEGAASALEGTHRLSVRLPAEGGDVIVTSSPFAVN